MSGFWDMVANLNPMKLIGDFILEWRHENTIREEAKSRLEIEKLQIYEEFAALYLQTTPYSSISSLKKSLIGRWEESNKILGSFAQHEFPRKSCAKCSYAFRQQPTDKPASSSKTLTAQGKRASTSQTATEVLDDRDGRLQLTSPDDRQRV